ncbi:hypothetical protein Tco_0523379 [Tanacetum coccineum]
MTANKMSKFDRFLVSKGLLVSFSYLSALCLDRNLSDHYHILMQELRIDYGPTPFNFFHSWFNMDGFDKMVEDTWKNLATVDLNEGDENTKFFHAILNSKRSQLAIRRTLVDGKWIVDPLALKSLFSSNHIDSSLILSHLFFADDAIFVGKWDSLNIRTIVNVLKCFHLASGLKINFHKSKLKGIGTRLEEVDATATTMGCLIFTTPFVHLGVKVGGAMSRIKSWDDVVAKVSSRLDKWKLKTLSIVGRLMR